MADWSDRNDSDPGVTLLGLFAWLLLGLFFAIGFYGYLARRDASRRWW